MGAPAAIVTRLSTSGLVPPPEKIATREPSTPESCCTVVRGWAMCTVNESPDGVGSADTSGGGSAGADAEATEAGTCATVGATVDAPPPHDTSETTSAPSATRRRIAPLHHEARAS